MLVKEVETTKSKGKKTRKKIYDFIKSYIEQNSFAPSYREISAATGVKSNSTIHTHLHRLQYMGVLDLGDTGQPRHIKILSDLIE